MSFDAINNIRNIEIAEFDYPLPDERIARYPLADRESCLLLTGNDKGQLSNHHFSDISKLLPYNTAVFYNDTRVINARMEMFKPSGARIEIFLLEPAEPEDYVRIFQARGECKWICLVGNRKRWKEGSLEKRVATDHGETVVYAELGEPMPGNAFEVTFRWENDALSWADVIEAAGKIPIPPYLKRETESTDTIDYQTVYARHEGSVAAPTAGLHFSDNLISTLERTGIRFFPVTLHVGAGTFQPVKSVNIGQHPMHTEVFSISLQSVAQILRMKESGEPITAVGTTTVRTLESIPYIGRALRKDLPLHVSQWEAYENPIENPVPELAFLKNFMEKNGLSSLTASTAIMIAPGFKWNIADSMITNFHQPQSTLLLLVSSFLGNDEIGNPLWRRYYDAALAGDYRFLSYGDACLFTRSGSKD